jgi:hypothetical protein
VELLIQHQMLMKPDQAQLSKARDTLRSRTDCQTVHNRGTSHMAQKHDDAAGNRINIKR